MYFMEHFKTTLVDDEAKKSVCEIGKLGGEAWRALSEEEKQPFVDLATRDKERHAEELANYVPVIREDDEEEKTKSKKVKPNKQDKHGKSDKVPKKAPSSGVEKVAKKPFVVGLKIKSVSEKADRRSQVVSDEEEDNHGDDEQGEEEEGSEANEEEEEGAAPDLDSAEEAGESSDEDGYSKKKKRKAKDRKEKESTSEKKKRHKKSSERGRDNKHSDSKRRRSSSDIGDKAEKKKRVSAPRGIKQCDLDEEHDLLNTNFVPYVTCKFPEDMKLRMEQHVVVLLPVYREFVSQLPANCADEETLEAVQQICSSPKTIVTGVVKGLRALPVADDVMDDGSEDSERHHYTVITLSVSGHVFEVLHADYSSPLHTTDMFLLDSKKYKDSLKQPWIQVNAQVRRLFQVEDDSGQAEWHEGSVYHINADYESNPFRAVKVAWLQQEVGTGEWLYSYMQTDNDCSPWELELSHFVLLEKMKSPEVPRSLLVGKLEAQPIIAHLKNCDSAVLFKDDITRCEDEFFLALPEEDRLDLNVISKLERAGRYSDGGGAGITLLFSDVQKMIRLSKQFNDCNRAFLPWRQAEMLDKTVLALKCALAKAHDLPCLQEAAAEDLQEEGLLLGEECEEV